MSLASRLPPCGFLFLTSFMCICSLLLCPLHSFAAMSQWTSSKKHRKHFQLLVPCSVAVMCHVEERSHSEGRWPWLLSLLSCFAILSVVQTFCHGHLNNNFRQRWSVSACVDVFVWVEVWTQVAYRFFFNTCWCWPGKCGWFRVCLCACVWVWLTG